MFAAHRGLTRGRLPYSLGYVAANGRPYKRETTVFLRSCLLYDVTLCTMYLIRGNESELSLFVLVSSISIASFDFCCPFFAAWNGKWKYKTQAVDSLVKFYVDKILTYSVLYVLRLYMKININNVNITLYSCISKWYYTIQDIYLQVGLVGLWCLTPTIFQLYRGSQFHWWRNLEYSEKYYLHAASHWQTLSHNVVSCTHRHEWDLNSQRWWW